MKEQLKKAAKFLQDNTGVQSSMRLNVAYIAFISGIILFTIAMYFIIMGFKGNALSFETLSGIGIVITSIAGLLTGVMYNQRAQKKIENNKAAETKRDEIINENT